MTFIGYKETNRHTKYIEKHIERGIAIRLIDWDNKFRYRLGHGILYIQIGTPNFNRIDWNTKF